MIKKIKKKKSLFLFGFLILLMIIGSIFFLVKEAVFPSDLLQTFDRENGNKIMEVGHRLGYNWEGRENPLLIDLYVDGVPRASDFVLATEGNVYQNFLPVYAQLTDATNAYCNLLDSASKTQIKLTSGKEKIGFSTNEFVWKQEDLGCHVLEWHIYNGRKPDNRVLCSNINANAEYNINGEVLIKQESICVIGDIVEGTEETLDRTHEDVDLSKPDLNCIETKQVEVDDGVFETKCAIYDLIKPEPEPIIEIPFEDTGIPDKIGVPCTSFDENGKCLIKSTDSLEKESNIPWFTILSILAVVLLFGGSAIFYLLRWKK